MTAGRFWWDEEAEAWVDKYQGDEALRVRLGQVIKVIGVQGVQRAHGHMTDKLASYGDSSTPLRDKTRYFMWLLQRELDDYWEQNAPDPQ